MCKKSHFPTLNVPISILGKRIADGRKTMTRSEYDEKLHELESPTPVFSTFAASMSLIGLSLAIVQFVL